MSIHLGDSVVYGHLWTTDEARSLLGERARFSAWLDILAALAEAQAEVGLIPPDAARSIRRHATIDRLDLEQVGFETRATGHSTLGLIRTLQEILPEDSRQWLYFGATVQDLTDTWIAMVMRKVGDLIDRDLARIERACVGHSRAHRSTPMLGRTHAQPGLPITFGFKTAVWGMEIHRHRQRLAEGRPRWQVVQLGGALGTMEFWGAHSLPLLEAFARKMDLAAPVIPWITSRDGVAEFTHLLAMVSTTMAKIGNEIMELQRHELGEVREGFTPETVGSITMPQKRNPELSEHLDTLARLIRSHSTVVTEAMIQIHERDGRAWKAEWIAVPEAASMTLAATGFAATLLEGLEVDSERMVGNIERTDGYVFSEPVMRALADVIGKHQAHQVVYEVAMNGRQDGMHLIDALCRDRRVSDHFEREALTLLFDVDRATGAAPDFVDRVLGELE